MGDSDDSDDGTGSQATDDGAIDDAPAVRERARDGERQPGPASGDIRDVDFDNGFLHPVQFEEGMAVTVVDGVFEDGDRATGSFLALYVAGVAFGDLDGDGTEEAAVATSVSTGGSGLFDAIHVYGIDAGDVVLRGSEFFGDRADGGIWHHEIVDGHLRVESFLTDQGACCPNMINVTRHALGPYDLALVENFDVLRWVPIGGISQEIRFLDGTSSAVLSMAEYEDFSFTDFDAAAGQQVTIRQVRGPEPIVISLLGPDGTRVADEYGDTLVYTLETSGVHTIDIAFAAIDRGASSVFVFSIDGSDVAAPAWTPRLRQVVVDEDPDVVLTAAAPAFSVDDGGQLNGIVDQWLDAETDWWIADVVAYPPVERDDGPELAGEYQLNYVVSYATDEIVSVHWYYYEYVCCRPYPNYGQNSLVLDVSAGRSIADDEILDTARWDEIHAIWFAAHEAQHEYRPDDTWWDGPGWTSLIVVPGGVEFGTDRQGAAGASSTFVSWSALGDLARPDFVARLGDGAVPTGW